MIIMLNGSFGVGKTTVARLLRAQLSGSRIYDPELIGSVMMRLPRWIRLQGAGTDDFQDIVAWRRSVVAGTQLCHTLSAGRVIVPMTFSHRPYFDQIVGGLRELDADLRVFCLRASIATIHARLRGRGVMLEEPQGAWVLRRVAECVAAHQDPHFGAPIDTEGRSATTITQQILEQLRQPEQ